MSIPEFDLVLAPCSFLYSRAQTGGGKISTSSQLVVLCCSWANIGGERKLADRCTHQPAVFPFAVQSQAGEGQELCCLTEA